MNICLIGGIYAKGGLRSSYLKSTPETTLETGLRAAGHAVTTLSHYDDVPFGDFDIVHVHHLSYGAVRVASDPSTSRFVFTAHDDSVMNGRSVGWARQLAMRYVMSRADAIVSLSQAEAEFRRSDYRNQGALLETIPNGIAAEQFKPVRRNSAGKNAPWKLLFVGQLIPLKGCDLLLRALARIQHKYVLTFAYQTDFLEQELRELARSLGIAAQVEFLGKQDPDQLASLHQNSDLLILPSSSEALPSAITEAMLSGLPFIASAVGGVPEQAAGFGYLLQRRRVEDLAGALSYVLDHYPEFARSGEAMSAHARSTFSIEAMMEKHIRLYERVVELKNTRRSGRTLLDTLVRVAVRRRGQRSPQRSNPRRVVGT